MRQTGRTSDLITFELYKAPQDGVETLHLVTSLPSRPGTVIRCWSLRGGQLDSRGLEDVAAYVHARAYEALLALGVQQTLF